MAEPLRIAIAGLGTVGAGVVKILQTHSELIQNKTARPIEIIAVSSKSREKQRDIDVSNYEWADKTLALVDTPCDVIIELIGGSDGIAYELCSSALKAGKSVITANKALLAHHGFELAEIAQSNNVQLMYEAAVAGGIPIIKTIREGLAGNELSTVHGILNGTCNYILTEMEKTGHDFELILAQAQKEGFAESDPSFDIDGIDTAHKLCILTALAFGVVPEFDKIDITGIRTLGLKDIQFAAELGYKIKLLGTAQKIDDKLFQNVSPCLVPNSHALAAVDSSFNAVYVKGDFVDSTMSIGRGAGQGPTASAVVADIIDLATARYSKTFGQDTDKLVRAKWAEDMEMVSCFYMHLVAVDRPGVIADISAILRDHDISMESLIQRGRDPDRPVSIVMTTHHVSFAQIKAAAEKISELGSVENKPVVLRIESALAA
jgi:homoserine dehydrogenase